MNALCYDVASYRAKIRMTSLKHLLVEGKSDQRLFKLLLSELLGKSHSVVVECAELIRNAEPMGNRAKVEAVCEGLNGSVHAEKITGFVDREFRGFELGDPVNDTIGTHYQAGRIVWSRGHSLENYFFCIEVLRPPLRSLTGTVHFEDALTMFESSLASVMRIASAVSLSAYDNQLITLLARSITPNVFRYANSIFSVEEAEWAHVLRSQHKLDEARIASVLTSYSNWIARLGEADAITCKWICHGHSGMSIIFSAYAFFVQQACSMNGEANPEREARCIQRLDDAMRSSICGDRWIELCINETIESPVDSFKSTGLVDE